MGSSRAFASGRGIAERVGLPDPTAARRRQRRRGVRRGGRSSGEIAASAEALRLLKLLREAGRRPVSLEEIAASGIQYPATAIYELELAGHPIEHLATGVRLAEDTDPPRAGC